MKFSLVGGLYGLAYVAVGMLYIYWAMPSWVLWAYVGTYLGCIALGVIAKKIKAVTIFGQVISLLMIMSFPVVFGVSVIQHSGWMMGILGIFVNVATYVMFFSAIYRNIEADEKLVNLTK